ncbi:MAG: hypothetical protein HN617_04455 [Planctomycetaceae bacterium]|jgi:hypothetical protein|nr:hypothetical protein [Planctomycetaceae bacterium]MBT5123867.1 hypothetical protein [Planctomycetaceae bacterium]MBT5884725.1 hypothetical protein [Planctomycetaceae bacterium]MBT7254110.1 hypothetical protein [Planctomycetaceae bacterium]MBT7916775.1 hypothetical protein [Planctomycetaceae bacterium]
MAKPLRVTADQPVLLRAVQRCHKFLASLKLAVVLIFSMAFTLGYATFVEAAYGTAVVQFFVYQTWWFNALNFTLGVNIFCAAAIRYPWKRNQTGFVITHIGLLTLLIGAAIGRKYGVDAQIPIFEHKMENFAFDRGRMFFDLEIVDDHSESSQHIHDEFVHSQMRVPFLAGPFNWEDYDHHFGYTLEGGKKFGLTQGLLKNGLRWSSGHIFKLAQRHEPNDIVVDQTVTHEGQSNGQQLKIEVLDFQADSQKSSLPRVEIVLSNPPQQFLDEDTGKQEERPGAFDTESPNAFPITIMPLSNPLEAIYGDIYPYGFSQPQQAGGGKVMLWIAPDAEYRAAFLEAAPTGDLGVKGRVVLRIAGTTHQLDLNTTGLDAIIELPNSDYKVKVLGLWNDAVEGRPGTAGTTYGYSNNIQQTEPESPTAHLQVLDKNGTPWGREILLFANKPHHNVFDFDQKIYGTYWFDFSKKSIQPFGGDPAAQEQVYSRIEFLQGDDGTLYYRYWNRRTNKLVSVGSLVDDGGVNSAVDGFQMPQFKSPLRFYVNDFESSDKPRVASQALPFNSDLQIVQRRVMALVRVTFGTTTEEHWIRAFVGAPGERRATDQEIRVYDKPSGQTLVVSMPTQALDIGFRIRLKDFERKLDPGTRQASHFSSWVDFVDLNNTREIWGVGIGESTAHPIKVPARTESGRLSDADNAHSVSGFAMVAAKQGTVVYWIDAQQREINITQLDTGDTKPFLNGQILRQRNQGQGSSGGLNQPHSLAFDVENNRLYWIDTIGGNTMIQSMSIFDDEPPQRIALSAGVISNIALDPINETIYWIDSLNNQIMRCPLDGSTPPTIVVTNIPKPNGLAVAQQTGTIYWGQTAITADGTATVGTIVSRGIDSSRPPKVIARLEIDNYCVSLTLDQQHDTLYFIEAPQPAKEYIGQHSAELRSTHYLKSISTTGGNEHVFDVPDLDLADHLQVFGETVYWDQSASFGHDVFITMNAPVQFDSPTNGHSYRLFQESFNGPWKPGEAEYERVIPADSLQTDLYLSVLTVNRDPGRAIRNFGCLIVCLGIAIMFYMKAYFFKPKSSKQSSKQSFNKLFEPADATEQSTSTDAT